jgi:hypothetical protein
MKQNLKRKMKATLINSGTEGISQTELIWKHRTYRVKDNPRGITGEEIKEILEDWRVKGYVQRFEIKRGKKPKRIWRATRTILTSEL